jgi:hypothetical protein
MQQPDVYSMNELVGALLQSESCVQLVHLSGIKADINSNKNKTDN